MARKARKLYEMLRAEGWRPGMTVKKTVTMQHFSEGCGCDADGFPVEDGKATFHLGEDSGGYRVRDLWENLVVNLSDGQPVGPSFVNQFMTPRQQATTLYEAGGAMSAVDASAFTAVMGQLLVVETLKSYDKEEYVVRRMIPTYNTPFEQEKIIGVAPPKDPGKNQLRTEPGEPLKYFGMGPQYVQTPLTVKEMAGIALTKEAIFFDRTGQITEQAAQVGDLLAYSEEQECIGCVIGGVTDPILFQEQRQVDSGLVTLDLFQGGTTGMPPTPAAAATSYPNSSATAGVYGKYAHQQGDLYTSRSYPFVNDVPANPLNDYKAVELDDQYFSNTVDPNRGRPIVVGKPFILAPHTQRIRLMRVLEGESIYSLTQQGLTTAGAVLSGAPNILNRIGLTIDQVKTSRLLKAELVAQLGLTAAQADLVWFYGDIEAAFRYNVNWPLTMVSAPTNSEAEFEQDIVLRWKASKRGRCSVREPRKFLRNNLVAQVAQVG